jgi:N-acetylglutamate synthase-like GNAT family acetyltransferase
MEALAIKPGAAIRSIARSLKELVLKTCGIAKQSGVGELYFYCEDAATERFAEKHGFQRMNFTLYRARVKDIEQRYELT